MGRLDGRVAIITGAAQGIGAAYAKALAGEGARLALADIQDAGPVAKEIEAGFQGAETLALGTDVSDEAQVNDMVAKTVERFGKLDILISNAAMFASISHKPFTDIPVEEWDRLMAVNVKGPWLCAKAAVPEMQKNGYGKIVNIASGTLFKGNPNILHYVTSKGAILAMTRSMSNEVGGDGICVNTLAPGLTMSEGVLGAKEFMEGRDANMASRALKRYQEPEDLTGAMLFLVSPDSDFMTGQCMVVDGGSVHH
ncbi:MAG: glucose 1-dehydrogenase [Rhodospirillales bacterium]|jgi:NAD(P)-dependent dehydrogenase (short-subunit alcohol dehydrogenase family)|nr:glucose 1-dehydrogenase [Rhodospirillales bacterium]MDP6644068.1 glucose 1-dehydrogenase [Rhodospirillales bacterium]MDP6842704.1 glucose 1-dehydrogenase [Rhodospirillales bacterium]|tara:strand:- start:2975 stop:3736 length:762 start_codon:yes stop_codon:yes gene_type:complete